MPAKKKPVLIQVGHHLISPDDVASISKIRNRNLYVVRLKSQPNAEHPCWAKKAELETLLDYFDIKVSSIVEEEEPEQQYPRAARSVF